MQTFSIKEVLKFGWEKTKQNFPQVFTLLLVLLFVNLSMSFLNKALDKGFDYHTSLLYVFTLIGFAVIEIILVMNIIKQGLIIARGGQGNGRAIFEYPEKFWSFILAQICGGVVILIGFILLIVPGIILALMLGFARPAVVDMKLGPIMALKKSKEITKGHLWELFLLFLVLCLLNIAGAIVLGIGLIVTIPVSFFAYLRVYDLLLLDSSKPKESSPAMDK